MRDGVAAFSTQIGQQFATDLYSTLKSFGRLAATVTQSTLEIGFTAFINASVDRCRFVKTIINRYEKVDLYRIYEDAYLRLGDRLYSEESLITDERMRRLIITGTAGSGKSCLMRRALLRMVEVNYGVFPIFIELRALNNLKNPDLLRHAIGFLEPHVAALTPKLTERLFKRGKILLLLDGYDELYDTVRSDVSQQIQDIAYKFPNCRMIISGRPDQTFTTWHGFDEYRVETFNKKQCLSLIKKAIFPEEQRLRFYHVVSNSLFDTHEEYLSNPLLTYVMLMTADQFLDFPDEMSSFYAKAFETLYSGHDLVKSGIFRREVKCQMKIKDMERILQYFCASSYLDGHYQYTEDSIRKYLSVAMEVTKTSFDTGDLIFDLTRSYCLLVVDGTAYSYIHRTFQEYFAATCVTQSERIDYLSYNSSIVNSRRENSSYIKLLMEVGYEKLQERYLIPTLTRYISEMRPIARANPRRFLQSHLSGVGVGLDGGIRVLVWGGLPPFLRSSWWGFAVTFLSIYQPQRFPDDSFVVMEDIEFVSRQRSVRFVDDDSDISEYYDVEFEIVPQAALRKLRFYKAMLRRLLLIEKELDLLLKNVEEDRSLISRSKKRP